jgi:flagellar biosynthesis/type III secretory pathway protein FliH
MSRLLRSAVLSLTPVSLGDRDDPLAGFGGDLDACLAAVEAGAYERGRQDGMRVGYELSMADQSTMTGAVQRAFDAALVEMRSCRAAEAAGIAALAMEIARAVVGSEPHDGGVALGARLREVLASVDDRPVHIAVHPGDTAILSGALADVDGLTLVADATLSPGEARVHGRWAEADVTRSAAWLAIQRALAG